MGRRGGVLSRAIAREVARSIRQSARDAQRAAVQQQRMQVRAAKDYAKYARLQYVEQRAEEAAEKTAALNARVDELKGILPHTLAVNDAVSFNSLRVKEQYPPFSLPTDLASPNSAPQDVSAYLSSVKEPGWFARLMPGAAERHAQALEDARRRHAEDLAQYNSREESRRRRVEQLKANYDQARQKALAEARQRNSEVDELEAAYRAGEEDAVVTYNEMVLERSEYPDGFPQNFQLTYLPGPKQLNVEYELPSVKIVPPVGEYKYVKTRDAIDEKPRKQSEIKFLYTDVVAAVALRTVHEVFEADQSGHVQVVVFNGYVRGIDPATGLDARPYLVSVGAPKVKFNSLDLRRIDKLACLHSIGGRISSRPADLVGVEPLADDGTTNVSSRRSTSASQRGSSARRVASGAASVPTAGTPINDAPRRHLAQIVAQYERSVSEDPRRCQGLLRDFCGEHRREIRVLVSAMEERVPAELSQSSQAVPSDILVARLAKRMHDNLGITEEFARWAVESWAQALGVTPGGR